MSIDITACLKALSAAFCQYRNHTSESTAKDLERQIDVLIGITSTGQPLLGFNAKELLAAECLSSLVGLLNETKVKQELYVKAMVLLFNLANDTETRELLHGAYHVTSTLAAFLIRQNSSTKDKLIFQCLQLLQRVTYCCSIITMGGYIEDLIKYLIKTSQKSECELTMPCLGVLANLCRHNLPVQAYIKALDNIRSIYRTLISFLSHSNLTVIVFSLSILTSLSLHEQLGEKLFNSKNTSQTFQLVFNILLNGEGSLTRKYAVDLFFDLLESPKIQQALIIQDHLPFWMERIIALLCNSKADEASKLFELLLRFCSVGGLRTILCQTLMAPTSHPINELYDAVIHWARQSVETHPTVAINALEFITEAYEEIVDSGLLNQLDSHVDVVCQLLSEVLVTPNETEDVLIKSKCLRVSKALDAVNVLCGEESLRSSLLKRLNLEHCWRLVEFQYLHNSTVNKGYCVGSSWSEEGVTVVLKMLDVLCHLKNVIPEIKNGIRSALQDQRLIPILAHALSSRSRESVQKALKIFKDASTLPDFQIIWLGEVLASNNVSKVEELAKRPTTEKISPPPSPPRHVPSVASRSSAMNGLPPTKFLDTPKRNARDSNIESLIQMMRSGMELKDPKASEIIDIYEAKLSALTTKESHLQDLLETKTLALSQADRIISKYRCRGAQSEAECSKLLQLLHQTEQKCESQSEQMNEMLERQKKAAKEMESSLKDLEHLKAVEEGHEQLKITFAEQAQRLETSQRSLMAAQEEHKAQAELNDMLRRHNDNLKNQHDIATKQLQQLEQERKKTAQQVQDKEAKCQELQKSLHRQEEETRARASDVEAHQNTIKAQQSELAKLSQNRKELNQKISSLELVIRQHEETIKEREKTIQQQQAEMDRHAQIAAMIHNLSSGKIPVHAASTMKS